MAERRGVLAAMTVSVTAIVVAELADPVPVLMWNGSASVPLGLYRVERATTLGRGDLVLVRPPEEARQLAIERGYLPAGVPLVKRIAARAGDHVCAASGRVTINGAHAAEAMKADRLGRPLTPWIGCRTLERDEFFVLMTSVPASFDSRYFGPIGRAAIVGRVVPLWTW